MATIGTTNVTLMDIARRLDPQGKIDKIVEILAQRNEMLEDMVWKEGNLPTGHLVTIRNGLPAGAWRKLNYGVAQEKSTTQQVTDTCGMLESYAEIDKDEAMINGNTAEYRLSEDKAFIEGMSQTLASTLVYGDTDLHPERFLGFAPRFDDTTAANGDNILLGDGAASANTSVWLVGWGDDTVCGIYPKGSQAGLMHEDLGQDTSTDSNGLMHEVLRSHYQFKAGLSVKNWKYIVRIANIDVDNLTKNASTGSDLIDLMVQSLEQIEELQSVRPAFYCNRTVRSFLRRQISNRNNVNLSFDEVAGKKVMNFDEVPVRRTDKIISAEETVA